MTGIKKYSDKFTWDRRLSWIRAKCQAEYRGERWDLTFEDYCVFWCTEQRFYRKGRDIQAWVLTRYDYQGPWNRENCCILLRENQLKVSVAQRFGRPWEKFYKEAIWYGQ